MVKLLLFFVILVALIALGKCGAKGFTAKPEADATRDRAKVGAKS